ncbi:hypothetical protein QQF64_008757 [Cirrhinus molitorella]|uniref:Uncharacterized protein n=1 Tax=Cirrhinus molitorella TaxID=172907 RepID=A0ABR3M735_9TELE
MCLSVSSSIPVWPHADIVQQGTSHPQSAMRSICTQRSTQSHQNRPTDTKATITLLRTRGFCSGPAVTLAQDSTKIQSMFPLSTHTHRSVSWLMSRRALVARSRTPALPPLVLPIARGGGEGQLFPG